MYANVAAAARRTNIQLREDITGRVLGGGQPYARVHARDNPPPAP